MANISRCRVELKEHGRSREDKERSFKQMFSAFKRKVSEAGVISEFKKKQYFESKSEKKRRKKKDQIREAQKDKLRDHFGDRQ